MNSLTTIEYLKNVDFLNNLPQLEDLADNCKMGLFSEGDFLFEEDETGDTLYILTSGKVEVFKDNCSITFREAGEYVGEMALLGNNSRSASVKAITEVNTIEIQKDYFLKFLSKNPAAFMPLFQALTGRWKEDLNTINSDYLEIQKQKKLNKRFSRLLDDTINEIFILEQGTYRILQGNSKATQNLNYTSEELCSLTFDQIFQDLSWTDLNEKLRNSVIKNQAQVSFESQNKRKDGSLYPVEVRVQCIDIEDPPLIYAIVEDISKKKAMEEHIKKLAFYDSLTKLPNRNLIMDRLENMIHRAERSNTKVAVICMDLDNFKAVNDSLGHEAGDQFLIQVANRFDVVLRKEDTFGRLGGDDFMILLPNLKDGYFPAKLAQRVIDIMKEPMELKGKQFRSNFSIGIAMFPDDGKNIETLFKNSNIAMYQAKESGGHAYRHYKSSMHEKIISRMTLEQELWDAVKNKEFKMFYQPKVSMSSGKIEGLEALIRWNRPDGKNVSPAVFIPLAEKSKIIHKIWDWTFESTCNQIQKWDQKYGEAIKIGINLSGRQFEQPDLVSRAKNIIIIGGIDPKYLEIEVTETAVMSNIETAIDALQKFRELGIQISLDDFGSGYTSLGYLKKLPIDTLKIDQSFVSDCTDNSNLAIIQGILAISQKMGFKTIAEGVETQEQHDFLKGLECDQFQGYLCSKPLPPDSVEKLIWPS